MNICKIVICILLLPYLSINAETVNNCKKLWGVANKINGITLSDMNLYICIDDPYNLYDNNDQFTSSIELIENSGGNSDISTTSPYPINQYNISNISNVSHINITNINNFTNLLTTSIPTTTSTTRYPTTTYLRTNNPTTTTISPTTFSPKTTSTTSKPISNIPDNKNNNDIITVKKNITINSTTMYFSNDVEKTPINNNITTEDNTPIIIILSIVGTFILTGCCSGCAYLIWKRKKLKIDDNVPKIPQPLYKKPENKKITTIKTKNNIKKTNRRIKPKITNSPPIIMKKSPTKRLSKTILKRQFKPQLIPTYDVKLPQNIPRDLTPTTKDALQANNGEDWYKDTFSQELGLEPPPGPPPLIQTKTKNFEPPIPKRNFKNAVRKIGVANGIQRQVNKFENRKY